ncbi:MAG: sialate O-acetylesterase [Verrucomicrobia bacterium]|nr:sialate O-acetylesterase [Verrucomicrobiota bacterium]
MAYSISFLRRFIFIAGAFALGQAASQAEVKLPSVFDDHMVLQQGQKLPIWGWADPGESVTVSVAGQTKKTKAGKDGAWDVHLKPLKASKTPVAFSVKGSNSIEFEDVLVGEVWLCSGQSNMEWRVSQSDNPKEEIAAAKHPLIRHIKIPHRPSSTPEKDVTPERGGWEVCSPETVGNFTGVGYFFARNLLDELDVPIGLLGCNWGGTRIEPWTTPSGFKSVPALKEIAEKLDTFPQKRDNGSINHQSALALHNGMISPINPYGIRGALWYQGESNNGEGMLYYEKKKALINGWRDIWNNKKMPFYFVQLAPYKYGGEPTRLAGIWQAQLETLKVPHTGMAVTTDIGNIRDIHPRNKQEVGRRLALWALTKDYGKKGIEYSGPLFKSARFRKDTAIVRFTHADDLKSTNGKALSHWEVAGEDEKFTAAQAEIKGSTVVARSDTVKKPKFVRFGYHQEAEPNLANGAGLPASPFTTGEVK